MNFRKSVTEHMLKEQIAQEAAAASQTADLKYMPIPVPAGDIALGLAANNIMPLLVDIPHGFKRKTNIWHVWADNWFYQGLDYWPVAVPGVDLQMALNNLTVCIRGRDLENDYKMAGVAYLASLWFSSPDGPPIVKPSRSDRAADK